ncbi:hypothetical protein Nmel_012396, partial [Mimus melanotis]
MFPCFSLLEGFYSLEWRGSGRGAGLGNHRGRITVGKCNSVPDPKRFEERNLFLVSISKCCSGCYLHLMVLCYVEGG